MASRVLCDCEALETLRLRHLGCHCISGDLDDISIRRILYFPQAVELVNVETLELHKRLEVVEVEGSL